MRSLAIILLVPIVLVAALIAFVLGGSIVFNPGRVLDSLPDYPSSQIVMTTKFGGSFPDQSSLYQRIFRSSASGEKVFSFYDEFLKEKGWELKWDVKADRSNNYNAARFYDKRMVGRYEVGISGPSPSAREPGNGDWYYLTVRQIGL